MLIYQLLKKILIFNRFQLFSKNLLGTQDKLDNWTLIKFHFKRIGNEIMSNFGDKKLDDTIKADIMCILFVQNRYQLCIFYY